MKLKAFALFSSLLSALLGASALAASQTDHYETVICDNCSYDRARVIANEAKYTPKLKCFIRKGGGPEDEQCWSTTTKLVVYDMATQQAHGFFIGHQSQGLPHPNMPVSVLDMPQPPADVVSALAYMVQTYQIMRNVTRNLQQNFDFTPLLNSILQKNVQQNAPAAAQSCADSPEMKVMRLIRDPVAKGNLLFEANERLASERSYISEFHNVRITGANFSVDTRSNSIGGTVEYYTTPQHHVTDFTVRTSYFGSGPRNQAVFRLDMNNGSIDVSPDLYRTVLSDRPLITIMESQRNGISELLKSEDLSFCAAEVIDQIYPKIVTPQGDVPAYGNGNNSGALVRPGFGQMPLSRRGGGGGSYQTCDHHYYDRQGKLLFTIGGPCP